MLKTAEKDKQKPKNKSPHTSYVKLAQSGQSLVDPNLSADFRFQGWTKITCNCILLEHAADLPAHTGTITLLTTSANRERPLCDCPKLTCVFEESVPSRCEPLLLLLCHLSPRQITRDQWKRGTNITTTFHSEI